MQYTSDLAKCLAPYVFCNASKRGELDVIEVSHPFFKAALLLQGAQLLSFQPTDQQAWIWLSEQAEYKRGTSVRGGIPICWPWFGDADKNPKAVQDMIGTEKPPAHGFARTHDWTLTKIREDCHQVGLSLQLEVTASELWQADALLTLNIGMAKDSLSLELTTQAKEQPIQLSQALHTYFPTTDIHQTRVSGFHNYNYTDALDGWIEKTQNGNIRFNSETDRVYQAPARQQLITPTQTLTLTSNSQSAIVWNPWIAKGARLSQFPDEAWQHMFCVETANALDDCVEIPANQAHSLTMCLGKPCISP